MLNCCFECKTSYVHYLFIFGSSWIIPVDFRVTSSCSPCDPYMALRRPYINHRSTIHRPHVDHRSTVYSHHRSTIDHRSTRRRWISMAGPSPGLTLALAVPWLALGFPLAFPWLPPGFPLASPWLPPGSPWLSEGEDFHLVTLQD